MEKKELLDLIKEYKKIKGYADGGEVPQDPQLGMGDLMESQRQQGYDPLLQSTMGDVLMAERNNGYDQPKDSGIDTPPTIDDNYNNLFNNLEDTAISKESKLLNKVPIKNKEYDFLKKIIDSEPNSGDQLKEAQKQRDNNISGNQIMKGLTLASSGISHTNPDRALKLLEDQDKYVNLPVQKFEENQANQKNDPKSKVSEAYRQLYGKLMGTPAPEGWSASDLEKVSPLFEKYMQAKETAQARKDTQMYNLQARAQEADLRHQDRMLYLTDRQQREAEIQRHNNEIEKIKHEQTDISGSRLGLSATKTIEQDPTIKKANDRLNSARTALDQLDDKSQPLTVNRLNAIQIDLANALNFMGQQGASDYKAKSDKLVTLRSRMAAATQSWNPNVEDMRELAPEVYNEVKAYANSIHQSVNKIKQQREKELSTKYGKSTGEGGTTDKRLKDIYKDKNIVTKEQLSAYAKQHKLDEKAAKDILTKGGYSVE